MRFPEIWSRIDLRLTSDDPPDDPPGPSPDGPQMTLQDPISRPQETYAQNKAIFDVLLTVAERKDGSSKDWIRPPTCCQELTNG